MKNKREINNLTRHVTLDDLKGVKFELEVNCVGVTGSTMEWVSMPILVNGIKVGKANSVSIFKPALKEALGITND